MLVHEAKVEHLTAARHLTFVSVQLASPIEDLDWDFETETETWIWRSNRRNSRIKEVESVLEAIFSDRFPKKPDVVVFPEYSVPKEALAKIDFARWSDRTSSIIIAGSYFENEEGPRLRNNICSIYLPGSAVIQIGKKYSAGNEKGLLPAQDIPNVARLVWTPTGEEPISISVFLCRDYLTPFSEQEVRIANLDGARLDRFSVLDWDREGLNIVVMNNDKSQLFEGAAAFDTREMHGRRKAVLLANCASDKSDLGTALIVPSIERERADIVASLPPKNPGILLAELRLWGGIELRRSDPGTKLAYPLKHIDLFSIDTSNEQLISRLKVEGPAPSARGIWHPAYLEELRKIIVLDFFVAKSTLVTINEAFDHDRIRHVKAGFVRGVQDVMIRRYAPRYLLKNGRVPLSLPFSYMSDVQMREIFEYDKESSNLQVVIYPEKLLKYRGEVVLQERAWADAHDLIKEVVLSTDVSDLIKRSCELATNVELTEDGTSALFPTDIRPVFSLGAESHLPVGREYGHRKEYYVLISAKRSERDESPSDRFRREMILGFLMNNQSVREIAEIDSRPQKFHYSIQIEASTYEVDDIIYHMHVWAHKNGITFGTRTYEVWKYLKREAIAGIEHTTMDEFERDFLADPTLLEHWFETHRAWHAAGCPRRFTYLPDWAPGAANQNERTRWLRSLRDQNRSSFQLLKIHVTGLLKSAAMASIGNPDSSLSPNMTLHHGRGVGGQPCLRT